MLDFYFGLLGIIMLYNFGFFVLRILVRILPKGVTLVLAPIALWIAYKTGLIALTFGLLELAVVYFLFIRPIGKGIFGLVGWHIDASNRREAEFQRELDRKFQFHGPRF